ncbi:MAG TPA: hypothetical protein ENH85_11305 [Candidatus Scalindua sp.]|nr:hypothetical protein [Candidatus Scalindua sp.]
MDDISITLIIVILLLTVVIVFNRIMFVRRITGLTTNEVKLEPLPKPKKLYHKYYITVGIVEDLENDESLETVNQIMLQIRQELASAFGMTDVELTGKTTSPWL